MRKPPPSTEPDLKDPPPAELATTEPEDVPPPEALYTRAEAMRLLGVGHTQLSERGRNGELRAFRVGRDVFYERAEVDALAGRDTQGTLLREATALLRQSHQHNEAGLRLLLDAARGFADTTRDIVRETLQRNRELEVEAARQRDLLAKAAKEETEQIVTVMAAEAEAERAKAITRTAERAVPVLIARLTGQGASQDAAIAAAVRSFASDPELVARLRSGLRPEEQGALDALLAPLTPAQGPGPSSEGQGPRTDPKAKGT